MAKLYDLAIIGGGSGGLSTAVGAAKLGAKVALIEKNKLGGECLWTGCVPSKALIKVAEVARTVATHREYGLKASKVEVDFPKVLGYVQKVIKKIEPNDSPERMRSLGIDVFFGAGSFKDRNSFVVGSKTVRAKRFVISTGSSPYKFPLQGLEEAGYLTNETVFTNKVFPKTFLIIGGGPIGSEMAQAFSRLGSKVFIFVRGDHILSKEDPEAAEVVESAFEREGITIVRNAELVRVERKGKKKIIHYKVKGKSLSQSGDEILLAIGRSPNTQGLNLDGIGVKYDKRRIHVDSRLRTSVKNIYAIGDVKGGLMFTHTASYEAGVVIMNALFHFPAKADYRVVPWTTFTDPELARVGITSSQARERGIKHVVSRFDLAHNDRAQTENEPEGFIKAVTDKKGRILGVTIVGKSAGELIAEYALAMKNGLKLQDIYKTIHTYPTLALANQQLVGKFLEKKLTPFAKRLLKFIFRFG
ncbi:dihydrolipoyl dehydrogenase [Candidatus Woesearchaeota archaeon]|nr:MAG: dihydrolipoyl dehydrogenase [Candidatus Woesearchaeota archaeon]